ncbi:double-strand break repair protein AddB [Primorskyibacter sp. S87]|uniref:double-strand break repair protein AddB n=1 Tax=Primorskyibacter sp. S87 TaxID=3415126 RepID=UPI003C7C4D4B
MFDPSSSSRVFALSPGVDFPRALVSGLRARLQHRPPEDMARVELIVNTRRMARRVRDLFDAGPACLLPRISLLTDLTRHREAARLPQAVPPLRRRLELTQLISKLLDQQPDLAARASIYDLADSLATLIDEMQGEGVSPEAVRALDVSDMSGHWARAQAFIGIAENFIEVEGGALDVQARQRKLVGMLVDRWRSLPPEHPVILAGSTGSRGTTMMLMEAVANLPQGAVILPGFDFDQPEDVWGQLDKALLSEDHPQYRFHKLMTRLGIRPADVTLWADNPAPCPDRNRLVSLALRPAPVTDAWLREGPALTGLSEATRNVTLLEAPSPRSEALAIALRLRQAAEDGQKAALITPDRMLTRQVAAALDRWNIVPDDSAGLPLQLSPPGRLLRHVAGLFSSPLSSDALLTLLKHPLCHDGGERGEHLRLTRDLELDLRRNGPPHPDSNSFQAFAVRHEKIPHHWLEWLTACFHGQEALSDRPLADWVDDLVRLSERIAAGSIALGSGSLWEKNAGQKAQALMTHLAEEAAFGGTMSARDFSDLVGALLSTEEVRDRDAPHEGIMIWGTLEARVQGADLLILAGLNEGSWPEAASPDPWLNREMRDKAGLLLPERRIGLSAHDFQIAAGAKEIWLSRATRSDDAETVASRWLNRMTNLLSGLPEQQGPEILAEMRDRGETWLAQSRALEEAPELVSASRPSPRPPVASRPRKLSVTEIKRLIRDPYSIYAKHVLRLRPLDPLVQMPDALLRGIVVHEILERFVRDSLRSPEMLNRDSFLSAARQLLNEKVAWPTARIAWFARLERIADAFIASEQSRRQTAIPVAFERKASLNVDPLDFCIIGVADRIDRDERGSLKIYDYKTGAPPSGPQQTKFDKQLLIEAAMAEKGGFREIDPAHVSDAIFIGLGNSLKEVSAPLDTESPEQVWDELRQLISAYFDPKQGFTSRRMLHKDTDRGDYDHLARFGEWDRTAMPEPEDLA